MRTSFRINGDEWRVVSVYPHDPLLIDRTGRLTLATTDPINRVIYLSGDLDGELLQHVLLHEIGHAIAVSHGLLRIIHAFMPKRLWVTVEEWLCNYLADFGPLAVKCAETVLECDLR